MICIHCHQAGVRKNAHTHTDKQNYYCPVMAFNYCFPFVISDNKQPDDEFIEKVCF
jgi:hypothetical protein